MCKLAAVNRVINTFCRCAAGAVILIIMLLVFAEVISRYILGLSHEFVPAISSWCMVWMTYFMLGVIHKARQHISIDILPNRLPLQYRTPLLTLFDVISLIFAILLCYGGTIYDLMVRQSDIYAVTVQFIPMWIVRICVPLGGVFLALFSCEHLINDARYLIKRTKVEP